MNRKVLFMFALLCAVAQGAWGWGRRQTQEQQTLFIHKLYFKTIDNET